MLLHILLLTFRKGVDIACTLEALEALAKSCVATRVWAPHGAEAKRSWHACVEIREDVEKTLASNEWAALMTAVAANAEVHKAWTFGTNEP